MKVFSFEHIFIDIFYLKNFSLTKQVVVPTTNMVVLSRPKHVISLKNGRRNLRQVFALWVGMPMFNQAIK